jgi:endoglucanase
MGKGFSLSTGSVTSPHLNSLLQRAALDNDIPIQLDVRGADTGTDAMAGVLASADVAAASLGFPIRNMHTVSETAHTGDVLACVHVVERFLRDADKSGLSRGNFQSAHPNLAGARLLEAERPAAKEEEGEKTGGEKSQ